MNESITKIIAKMVELNSHHIWIGQDEDGNERLVIDQKPVGRCFKVYAFMEEVAGIEAVLADFADILMMIMRYHPQAFENVREEVEGLAKYFRPALRDCWVDLWRRENQEEKTMAKQTWVCEVCNTPHPTQKGAESCERRHIKTDDATIMGFSFNQQPYPTTVRIRFSPNYGDFAEYTLRRVGPEGL